MLLFTGGCFNTNPLIITKTAKKYINSVFSDNDKANVANIIAPIDTPIRSQTAMLTVLFN